MLHLKDGFMGERAIVLPPMAIEMQASDPLVSSLYITDIGYYPHAVHHYRERTEPITQCVLLYCVKGKGHCRIGDDPHTLDVNASQYIILPAGQSHVYWSDEANPWTIYWVHFGGAHAPFYTQGASVPLDVKPGLTSRISDRNAIFEEIFFTISEGYNIENLRYASCLLHYYLGSMRFIQQFRKAERREDRYETDSLVDAAIHYMTENIERRLSLDSLAKYMGYSASHFSSVFRRATGESPLHYFNRLKMERACLLLSNTTMQINQICHKVGIDDCYYFSRLFSQTTGLSPKAYRELHKPAGDASQDHK